LGVEAKWGEKGEWMRERIQKWGVQGDRIHGIIVGGKRGM